MPKRAMSAPATRTHDAIHGHPAVIAYSDGLKSRSVHIPDGFLTNRVAFSLDAVSAASVLYAARRVKLAASGRLVPLMGVLAAFALAAQMLNFPILGGTSGHLVGGALLAILLGPMAAMMTMTTVVFAQALFLQDGGLIALGANIFNIATVTTLTGYAAFKLLGGPGSVGKKLAVVSGLAGWISVMASAVSCAFALVLSGAISLRLGLTAMAGYHALIGIAEGGLTAGTLLFIARVRPDLLKATERERFGGLDWAYTVLLVALPFGILVLGGSSDLPDPLQRLLTGAGASGRGAEGAQALASPGRFLDYAVRAGIFVMLIAAAYLVSRFAHIRRRGQ